MSSSHRLPSFTSEKPCPRCRELLHWSDINPPKVDYNTRTGNVWSVTLTRFCINCGYTEQGLVPVNQDPVWMEEKENPRDRTS
jgi:hypothetical protein